MLIDQGLSHALDPAGPWTVGYCPPGRRHLTSHLRDVGFSLEECRLAGLTSVGGSGPPYDVFRDRIMFRVRDEGGALVGFVGRATGHGQDKDPGAPRYLTSPSVEGGVYDQARVLFGLWEQRDALERAGAIPAVVEDVIDVLAVAVASASASDGAAPVVAVASPGAALTAQQAALLHRLAPRRAAILSAFDQDPAGRDAAAHTYDAFYGVEPTLLRLTLPAGSDPAQFLKEYGPAALADALAGTHPDLEPLTTLARSAIDARIAPWLEGGSPPVVERRFDAVPAAGVILGEPDHIVDLCLYLAGRVELPPEDVGAIVAERLPLPMMVLAGSRPAPRRPSLAARR
ncbi:MAG: toprim domain-containing protein [Frankia sp.]